MLEKMGEFFDNRLIGYEKHQLTCIESAQVTGIDLAPGMLEILKAWK